MSKQINSVRKSSFLGILSLKKIKKDVDQKYYDKNSVG